MQTVELYITHVSVYQHSGVYRLLGVRMFDFPEQFEIVEFLSQFPVFWAYFYVLFNLSD